MAVRNGGAQALASFATTASARHVGRRAGLVDEDQTRGIEQELALEPGPSPRLYVPSFLLARMRSFFLNVIPWRTINRSITDVENVSPRL